MNDRTLTKLAVAGLLGALLLLTSVCADAQDGINDEEYVLTYEATVLSRYENAYLSTYMVVISVGYPTEQICRDVLSAFVTSNGEGITVHTAECSRAENGDEDVS